MMKEENVITLEDDSRYLLLHDLEEIDGKRYFYAVGVTPDDELNMKDNLFFEVIEENGQTLVDKVDPNSDVYKKLITIELVDASVDLIPGAREQVEQFIDDMDARESGN